MKHILSILSVLPWVLLAACGSPPPPVIEPAPLPSVLVLDGFGRPAEGAEVWALDRGGLRPDEAVIASRSLGDWVGTTRAVARESVITGADGIARFEGAYGQGVMVAARKGALFGSYEAPMIEVGAELQMEARVAYPIQVRDAGGEPAAGVPVTLALRFEGKLRRLPSTAVSDADGRVLLFEPPAVAFTSADGGVPTGPRFAMARIPAKTLPSVAIRPSVGGVLTLPPTSGLDLTFTHGGFPEGHFEGLLQVFAAADGSRSDATLAMPIEASAATIDHVESDVGLRLVAVLRERGAAPGVYVGQAAGSLGDAGAWGAVESMPVPLDQGAFFSGRVVDEEGTPLPRQTVDLALSDDPATSWTVVTDDEGRYRWLVARTRSSLINVAVTGKSGGRRGASVVGNLERGAIVEVKDLVLRLR